MGCAKSKPMSENLIVSKQTTHFDRSEFVLAVFAGLPFFHSVSKEQLEKAAGCFELQEIGSGETVFELNESATTFYVIAEGVVRVVVTDEQGAERTICTKRGGDFFGEVALLHNCRRTAKVVVDEPCTLLVLRRKAYKHFHSQPWNKALTAWLRVSANHVMADSLRKIPFLSSLNEAQLAQLGELFRFVEKGEGEVIFTQGDKGDGFYIVSHGRVHVHTSGGASGRPMDLSHLRAGQYFGEMALVHDAPRAASATALDTCTLFCLHRADFERFLEIAPSARDHLNQMASQRTADSLRKQRIPFFRGLRREKLALLAEVCTMRSFAAGQRVFAQGEEHATSFFIVTHGDVRVLVDGQPKTTLQRGGYFGEVALVADVARTATVVAGHAEGCSCLVLERDDFLTIFAREPQALAEMEIRVMVQNATLKNVLRHPIGRQYFKQQLEQEFSQENIDFWLRTEEFYSVHRFGNRLRSLSVAHKDEVAEELADSAREIFAHFVSEDAPHQINIRSATRKQLAKDVKARRFDAGMFRAAQTEIYEMMQADNYARFKGSELFTRFLHEIGAYDHGTVEPTQMRISRTCTVVSPHSQRHVHGTLSQESVDSFDGGPGGGSPRGGARLSGKSSLRGDSERVWGQAAARAAAASPPASVTISNTVTVHSAGDGGGLVHSNHSRLRARSEV
eukprot:g2009.t1